MAQCNEVVIYKILQGKEQLFEQTRQKIAQQVAKFKGFISLETRPHSDEPNTYLDTCIWESKEDAHAAFSAFESLPDAAIFMTCMAGAPVYAGHFEMS